MRNAHAIAAPSLAQTLMRLGCTASVELNVQDARHLAASRQFLVPGTKIYVSYLPRQKWEDTHSACVAVRRAGFDPVPHIPVRLIPDRGTLDTMLAGLRRAAQVDEVLLISGDYADSIGPYSDTSEVLASGMLEDHGLTRVSVAGHPEGHPKVALGTIREAERQKVQLGAKAGLAVTLVTQFFFEPTPFLDWARELRTDGVRAHIRGGLAGPASLARLFRFSMRCGVGPSVRALGARGASLKNLLGDHGPDHLLCDLARDIDDDGPVFDGIHMFCFGGYLRTCEWLQCVAHGQLSIDQPGR